ncbi:MAG TPA: TIGR04372 family glycosyltransferase [Xanthobacteraceae bacterium]|jgi:putative glycosyltransferase (TIGR04372 family)
MWIERRCRLAYRYASEGKVGQAVAIADDLLARKVDLYDPTIARLGAVYSLQGRYEEAYRLFERMEERCHEVARELQYDRLGLRFFPSEMYSAIGHIGLFDKYVKAETLGIIPRRTNIIIGAPEDASNPAYLRYWEKYFSRITNQRTISCLAPLVYPLQAHLDVVRLGNRVRRFVSFSREVQLQWEAEGRGPLLDLSAEHRERGYQFLRSLGIPEGAWFVGLHVREGNDRMRDVRTADITTYRLAVEEIVKRGGWVVRIGNAEMRPLPSWPNTIDYAHSPKREDWMDVFVWAEGRFFIGTASGPQVIPTTFGKPVAIANYGPIAINVCGRGDIMLPKHYWHEKDGRYLALAERISSDSRSLESTRALAAMGIRVVDNSPEELRELVIEMMDRLESRYTETVQERALQERFAQTAAAYELYPVKIARAFMSRHSDLFGQDPQRASVV